MIDFGKIKLVIWDLDETFWSGILTEGGVSPIQKNIDLVKHLTDCGIINTICSKNDKASAEKVLESMGVAEQFVFNSIDWSPKGPRISSLLKEMGLRATNALFIDDNPVNLNEALHYEPALMTADPKDIKGLSEWVSNQEPKDKEHNRLSQYIVLQKKQESKQSYSSNEEFLFSTHTRVEIRKDCLNNVERIHELILRTNQLNFTKVRSSLEELQAVLKDNGFDCGYVNVRDDFGDYGTVGFYALRKEDRTLVHFLFSCRTIGQGVEQWVYARLGFPHLETAGEVVNRVTEAPSPAWINQEERFAADSFSAIAGEGRILIKGPCDLENTLHYIKADERIEREFTYVKPGTNETYFAHNHSAHILDLLLSQRQKQELLEDCHFVDPPMLDGKFFSGEYDWIVLSTFLESDFGVYHKKTDPQISVVIGDWAKPLCDLRYRAWYQTRNPEQPYYSLSDIDINRFVDQYEYRGHTTPEQYVDFLNAVLSKLPAKTRLCLILGATKYHEDEVKVRLHRALNDAVKAYAVSHPQICYVELDDCIEGRDDYGNQINHFRRIVYYRLSQKIVKVLSGEGLQSTAKLFVWLDGLAWWISRHMKEGGELKALLRRAYRWAKGGTEK